MDLTTLFNDLESKGFEVEKQRSYLSDGKYGVVITEISMGETRPSKESGKQPVELVKMSLDVVEPKEFAGLQTSLDFLIYSGKEEFGPSKNMTFGFWSLYEKATAMVSRKYFKLPKSAMTDSDKFIEMLTTKANEHLTDKVFYVERKKNKKGYRNTNFLAFDKEEAEEKSPLGAYPDETQIAAEDLASATTLSDDDNPFGREVENVTNGDNAKDDDDWL